jgi:hypothetical protein
MRHRIFRCQPLPAQLPPAGPDINEVYALETTAARRCCLIAVLVFANISADRENEYCDGWAEILNLLTKLRSEGDRAHVFLAFRGKERDIPNRPDAASADDSGR